jgi:hypothetical protein
LTFRKSSALREQQKWEYSGLERVGEAARRDINSFVGSIWHLAGAAEAVREQQNRE